MEQLNLEEIRKEINGINDEMLKLFIKRMDISVYSRKMIRWSLSL